MADVKVCDVDGKANAVTVEFTVDGRRYRKDLCPAHVKELIAKAKEVPRRGRPPKSKTTSSAGYRKKRTGKRGLR